MIQINYTEKLLLELFDSLNGKLSDSFKNQILNILKNNSSLPNENINNQKNNSTNICNHVKSRNRGLCKRRCINSVYCIYHQKINPNKNNINEITSNLPVNTSNCHPSYNKDDNKKQNLNKNDPNKQEIVNNNIFDENINSEYEFIPQLLDCSFLNDTVVDKYEKIIINKETKIKQNKCIYVENYSNNYTSLSQNKYLLNTDTFYFKEYKNYIYSLDTYDDIIYQYYSDEYSEYKKYLHEISYKYNKQIESLYFLKDLIPVANKILNVLKLPITTKKSRSYYHYIPKYKNIKFAEDSKMQLVLYKNNMLELPSSPSYNNNNNNKKKKKRNKKRYLLEYKLICDYYMSKVYKKISKDTFINFRTKAKLKNTFTYDKYKNYNKDQIYSLLEDTAKQIFESEGKRYETEPLLSIVSYICAFCHSIEENIYDEDNLSYCKNK